MHLKGFFVPFSAKKVHILQSILFYIDFSLYLKKDIRYGRKDSNEISSSNRMLNIIVPE